MGNSCEHCCKGLEDCCSYFGEGCKACYVCLLPCCNYTKQKLVGCCNDCSCSGLASCLECNHSPFIIFDKSCPEIVEVLASYEHRAHFVDDWFGDVVLLEHKESKSLVVLKMVDYFYESEFQEQSAQFSQRASLKHNNIVQLRHFVSRQEEGFCTSVYKSFLIFDYLLTDFASEFEKRIESGCFYTEAEFYPIMYQLVAGMAYLHSNFLYHGAIRMRNIFITPEYFKVADPHLFDHQNDYQRIYNDRQRYSQLVFLSPELVSELDKGNKEPQVDFFKSDVYSMGMVFLQLCSRVQSSQCYDYEQGVIFEDKITSHLQTIKINYHDFLYFTIKNMLTVKVSQRPTFQQILESLEKNEKCKQPIYQTQQMDISQQQDILQQSQIQSYDQPFQDNNTYDPQGLDMFGLGLLGTETPQKQKDVIENVKERYPDGSKYNGAKRNGLRHGKGKFIHSDGSYYDGQWKDNKMSGNGTLYNANGKVIYDGHWNNDQYNGNGTEYNQEQVPLLSQVDYRNLQQVSWVKYEGNFKNDLRDGFGTLIISNGDKYVGGFKNGIIHGHGSYQPKGGQAISGKWIQGIIQK